MNKLFSTLLLLLVFTTAFAQAAPAAETNSITDWITANLGTVFAIVVGVYELLVRYVPTIKNYSIVSLVIQIIQFLIPNKNKTGGEFK